jgi:hypothetical protein
MNLFDCFFEMLNKTMEEIAKADKRRKIREYEEETKDRTDRGE